MTAFEICQRIYDNAAPPEDDADCREFSEELKLERRIEQLTEGI